MTRKNSSLFFVEAMLYSLFRALLMTLLNWTTTQHTTNSNPQICIHCAGTASIGVSVTDPYSDFYGNTVLTFEILNSLRLRMPN